MSPQSTHAENKITTYYSQVSTVQKYTSPRCHKNINRFRTNLHSCNMRCLWVTHFICCDWSKLKVNRCWFVAWRRYWTRRRWLWQLKRSCPRLKTTVNNTVRPFCTLFTSARWNVFEVNSQQWLHAYINVNVTREFISRPHHHHNGKGKRKGCLLYTSDAADE